jgi:hypothetical protein
VAPKKNQFSGFLILFFIFYIYFFILGSGALIPYPSFGKKKKKEKRKCILILDFCSNT